MEVSRSDEGSTLKTAAKIKVDHGDVKTDWSFCNDKFTVGAKGDVLGLKDYPSTAGFSYETKP